MGIQVKFPISWEHLHNLLFENNDDMNKLFISIFNKCSENVNEILRNAENEIYFGTVIQLFKNSIKQSFENLKDFEENLKLKLEIIKKFHLIMYIMDNCEITEQMINISYYVKDVCDAFEDMQKMLWSQKKNFGKDVSSELLQIWPEKMKQIFKQNFAKFDYNTNIPTYIFHVLVRGALENIDRECLEMCNYVSFLNIESIDFYKNVAFRKILENLENLYS